MKRQLTRSIAAVATLLGLFASASAQTTDNPNRVRAGIRAGANFASMVEEGGDFDNEMKPGFAAGGFVEIPIVNFLSIQPELWYSQKGYKSTNTILGREYQYKAKLNYVDLPVLLKLKPTQQVGIVVGPQISWLTSSDYKFETPEGEFEQSYDYDNSNLRNNVLGGVVGLEYTSGHFVAGARYSLDFQQNDEDGNTNTPRFKNQVIGLSVGYRF